MRILCVLAITATCGFAAGPVMKLPLAADSTLEVRGNQKKALLRFDLAAVPAGNTIVSARLVFTLAAVRSESPLLPKRFEFSAGETRMMILAVKGPGEHSLDLTRQVRGARTLAIEVAGLETNPSATISSASLDVRYSKTAPRADAGGGVYQAAGQTGAIR